MLKQIAQFFLELGQQKHRQRTGWCHLGIRLPENDAEHSILTAQIAFVLAVLEKYPNPYYCSAMGAFHEIGEIRTTDINRISGLYVEKDEKKAIVDQTAPLGESGEKIFAMWREFEKPEHHFDASKIGKDADRLALMCQAKEYIETGHSEASQWFQSAQNSLETDSAKQLGKELETVSIHDWWKELKKSQK